MAKGKDLNTIVSKLTNNRDIRAAVARAQKTIDKKPAMDKNGSKATKWNDEVTKEIRKSR
jgi:hypothetical protein